MKRTKQEVLARRLKATAVAAGATLSTAGVADAAIVTDVVDETVLFGDSFFLDLDNDGNDDFEFTATSTGSSSSGRAYVRGQGSNGIFTTSTNWSYAQAFAGSESVGTGTGTTNSVGMLSSFTISSLGGGYGNFRGSTPRFLGLVFEATTGPNTTEFLYGWARVSVPTQGEIYIQDFAYEDSGAPIHVPNEVPEPSTLLLMASGAAGLLALRRRRKS